MGKLILCTGVRAKQPFHIGLTDTRVYSVEELCYYLYHNIYIISEDIFNETLVTWLKEQVSMENLAEKLSQLIENKNSMKDIIVSILCSADYYTELEIKQLIAIMDEINHRTPKEKLKIKAGNYLKYRNFSQAAREYENLLKGELREELETEEYGDILHNLAVAYIHTGTYGEAASVFREAYSRNHRRETLFQYLMALKLGGCTQEYEKELDNHKEGESLGHTIDAEISQARAEAEENAEGAGKSAGEEKQLISRWMQEYKKEFS